VEINQLASDETDKRVDVLGFFFLGTVFVEPPILQRLAGAVGPCRRKE
jgi:hypothetical protein